MEEATSHNFAHPHIAIASSAADHRAAGGIAGAPEFAAQ